MISAQLKQAMTRRNITASQLSAATGIGRPSISQYLSGKNTPGKRFKALLAEALDVPPEYFDAEAGADEVGVPNMPVSQAAALMGKSPQFVRVALQRGVVPFGFAVKVSGDRWSYHISPKRFYEYMGEVT
jgi:transcriptional regulator with XRE-family HTH domain